MKHLCCSRFLLLFLLSFSSLFASLNDKSAMVYYGEDISYPMVGIHDYIIVQPTHINTYTHGFKVYKEKMYAYVSIGEIDRDSDAYADIRGDWIVAENGAWKSKVLDLTNREYQKFLFEKMIEPQIKRGFKNFFFDTLDSYQLYAKTKEQKEASKKALIEIITEFHSRYPDAKLIINRGFEIIDEVHPFIEAMLFESYYYGLKGEELNYKENTIADREWLNTQLQKVKKYNLEIIALDYLQNPYSAKAEELVYQLKAKGFIPFVSNKELTSYGKSSKNAIKREILTLIDEKETDRKEQSAHIHGALPLEYMGYIEKLYDLNTKQLPNIENMHHYAGVIIWLHSEYKNPQKLLKWIVSLEKIGIKVSIVSTLPIQQKELLSKLGIEINNPINKELKSKISYKDKMLAYEVEPYIPTNFPYLTVSNAKRILEITASNNQKSTLSAITPWGGYAISSSFIVQLLDDNLWVIDPFEFFKESLRLKPLPVPDTTTQNGKRLFFSHIDGDGIMNKVEFNTELFSGDSIYKDILKTYKTPHSVSIVGAEIDANGLYPKISKRLENIVAKMYALENVEAATHTFSHPFYWDKAQKHHLDEKYRLKVPNYHFSLDYEIEGSLKEINLRYLQDRNYTANTIFWSGDCAPTHLVLENVYQNKILNINGGDTYITNLNPWLSYVAPIGLERGEYYQIYTGAQNENVYTNEWHGPFWGFKKVVQTFELTNSPRRLKPIDIYYHFYSGSKTASLNALKFVFDWVLKEDIMPIYTSEYIPIAMDYFTVSMSSAKGAYLVDGMQSIKTLRIEEKDVSIDFKESSNLIGYKHFEEHTYFHLNSSSKAIIKVASKASKKEQPYLISANAKVLLSQLSDKKLHMSFQGYVPLKLEFFIPQNCKLHSSEKVHLQKASTSVKLHYKNIKKVDIDVICK